MEIPLTASPVGPSPIVANAVPLTGEYGVPVAGVTLPSELIFVMKTRLSCNSLNDDSTSQPPLSYATPIGRPKPSFVGLWLNKLLPPAESSEPSDAMRTL